MQEKGHAQQNTGAWDDSDITPERGGKGTENISNESHTLINAAGLRHSKNMRREKQLKQYYSKFRLKIKIIKHE